MNLDILSAPSRRAFALVLAGTFLFLLAPLSARAASPDFLFTFNAPGRLPEAGSMAESWSPYFWVNSGAYLVIENGFGGTAHGALPALDPFRILYGASNALDTDAGYYPQNIFRLVTKQSWESAVTGVSFIIDEFNLTDTPNRDGYSGVLLFSHYRDGDNLYYAGVRNDGLAIIKKKINGAYYTLATVQIFGVKGKYNRDTMPSLLPRDRWTGMKLEASNRSDGSVFLRLFLDRENDGSFVSVLSAVDGGIGGEPLFSGSTGIRTDYIDARFDNFRVTNL